MHNRREWLWQTGGGLAAAAANKPGAAVIVDPQPLFPISPHLYMQFMEPLGSTDSSVEAAWDYVRDEWRKDFVDTVRDLSPGVIRFGGNFSRYYKWREGVGPANKRPWIRNYDWGGKETNRVGTDEFVSFCRQVGADPLYCVNFEADGIEAFQRTPEGNRAGSAEEAADWVSYANDPDNAERKSHGHPETYNIDLWQIGNETSYVTAAFPKDRAIAKSIEFAKAMKRRDPGIKLIGWGDKGRGSDVLWAGDMAAQAGEYLDYLAIHMMGQSPSRRDTVLEGLRYQSDPHAAWQELLELSGRVETRVAELEGAARGKDLAITEGHLSLKPHNANPLLYEWISAVYHARSLNIYQRHGARVKIATAADFNGTRWTVMAVQTPVPRGTSFLMPVGSIMRLFKRENGTHAVAVRSAPATLDIAASRTGDDVFLHILNMDSRRAVDATFEVAGREILSGRVLAIEPGGLRTYVDQDQPNVFRPVETILPATPQRLTWRVPAASVSAVKLRLKGDRL